MHEGIDTSTTPGQLMLSLFGAMAEWERTLIRERTRPGLAAAPARGRAGGRKAVVTPDRLQAARTLLDAVQSPTKVAQMLGVGSSTLYRALQEKAAV